MAFSPARAARVADFSSEFLALILSEEEIIAFSVMVLGIGIIITGQANTLPLLLIGSIVMNFRFYFCGPSQTGIVLMQADKERTPKLLGQLKSIASAAAIVATGADSTPRLSTRE